MTKKEGILQINAVIDRHGGTYYHRVFLPMSYLHGQSIEIDGKEHLISVKFIEFNGVSKVLSREMLSDADIVYTTWVVKNNTPELTFWRQHDGWKFLADYDDYILDEDNSTHAYFNPEWKPAFLQQTVFADFVTTTNKLLASKIYQFNDRIGIIPNILPVGEGQFTDKPEDKKYSKDKPLRIGICGSISHYYDFLTLKGAISRFAKNKEIAEKCEFYICGYQDTPQWNSILKLFTVKKNLKVFTIEGKEPEDYMQLYDNLDVVLAPLVDNTFNACKSGLKLIEASIKGCVVIGSYLYMQKEFNALCVANSPLEYEQFVTHLLEGDNYITLRDQLCKGNLDANDFSKRLEFTKEILKLTLSTKIDTLPSDVHVYGITYDDSQVTEFEKYDNSHIRTVEQSSYLFEYNVMRDIVPNALDNEYYGLFSWKFPQKTGVTKKLLAKLLDEIKYKDFGIINLSPDYFQGKYLKFSYEHHPGLKELLNLVCNDLGLKVKEPENVVYSNFFIARGDIYKKFLSEVINPAIELMEDKYFPLAMKDAGYKSGLPKEELIKKTGMDFYSLHTFVCERLLSIWLENNKDIKVKSLL